MSTHRILVTGGLGRLGLAIGAAAEARGWSALLSTRDPAKVEAFNQEAASKDWTRRAVVLRFADEASLKQEVAALIAAEGPIQGLVNNAYAAAPFSPVEELRWDSWGKLAEAELGQPLTLSQSLLAAGTLASIVNIGSIYGVMAPDFGIYTDGREPSPIYYGALKGGLLQMTRYLAVYWAEHGVRVNMVSAGGIENGQDPKFLEAYGRMVPTGRMVDRQEVANAVCFLLSPESSGINGTNLMVDAGRHAW